jgi:hypothetical protein
MEVIDSYKPPHASSVAGLWRSIKICVAVDWRPKALKTSYFAFLVCGLNMHK